MILFSRTIIFKKTLSILLLLSLSILLISCTDMLDVFKIDFTEEYETFIFTPKDIDNFNLEEYTAQPDKDTGKDYSLIKIPVKSQFTYSYQATLTNASGDKVYIGSYIYLPNLVAQSKQFFEELSAKMKKQFERQSESYDPSKIVYPDNYDVDEAMLMILDDYYYVLIRKENLVYELTIEGLSLNESQVKQNFIKKIDYIIEEEIK